ncbi:DUF2931 family protein [Enterobacter asburiae]|uniref:DUF2931 family protein n=1 Tax=Enterobacter asburiae TaxID=61645 RepID=UPI0021D0B13F|nr:DUF2931 family protein [Enterobacter asburiae]MCU6239915.1 DUF2931 family protein [Enterobacter asburiae]
MRLITLLLSGFFLTGCTSSSVQQLKAPWDKWYFSFSTPKALPAQVTLVKLIDNNKHGYIFQTIDQPQGDSVGTWSPYSGTGFSQFNQAKSPPIAMVFCWDSIIDKKVYETSLFFSPDTRERMIKSDPKWDNPKEPYYYRYLVIGLAPEGKVRVWLKNNGKPNVEQINTKIKTASGNALDMCKGVTKSDFSYGYDEDIKEFIKGKKYPYGNW